MKYKFKAEELTAESSLWQVYLMTGKIKGSRFNYYTTAVIALLLLFNSIFFSSEKILIFSIHSWASMGFNFTVTTLGFLITGFTIFATLNKPNMLLALMNHKDPKSGLPSLKYVYGIFMQVFISFITYTVIYLMIILFTQANGPLAQIVRLLPYSDCFKIVFVTICYSATGASLLYLVLIIKTFIFNIYSILMHALRWEYKERSTTSDNEKIINLLVEISKKLDTKPRRIDSANEDNWNS